MKNKEALNPYRHGGLLLWQLLSRIAWDIRPQSWRSRAKLSQLKNTHRGEKAVILCNGPSLLNSNFDLLEGVYTFGLNKINLLFDKKNFRPSSIVAVNRHVIEQNCDYYNETNIPLFLDSIATSRVRSRENIAFLHSIPIFLFAKDCSMSVHQGYTVTYVAMQLAFHMGFEKVAIIGADHSFSASGPANKVVASGQRDDDHFDPNYFSQGVKWNLPDLPGSERSYILARENYQSEGRELINATEGGNLEIFKRMPLAQFLQD